MSLSPHCGDKPIFKPCSLKGSGCLEHNGAHWMKEQIPSDWEEGQGPGKRLAYGVGRTKAGEKS